MSIKTNLIIGLLLSLTSFAHADQLWDTYKSKQVNLVLRIKTTDKGEGKTYIWQEVRVLNVLKNSFKIQIPRTLKIAHLREDAGIPLGYSTIYLESYNDEATLWKLKYGSASVSHFHK